MDFGGKTKKLILSIFGGHLGGLLIALILTFSAASFMSGWGLAVCIPVILLVYSFAVYNAMWTAGHEDQNSAHFGHIVLNPKRGLMIGLFANGLNILFGLVFLVCFILSQAGLLGSCQPLIIAYRIANAEIWPILNALDMAFLGEVVSDFSRFNIFQVILYALLPLVPVAICEVGYLLGIRDLSVMQKLVYKNKKKTESGTPGIRKADRRADGKAGKAWVTETDSDVTQKEKSSLLKKLLYQNDDKDKH